ncbi:MAG TPA: acetylxylan esterase [Trueperaceae bacterium]|nr:acetylxylan esterase [Trueperaceae bacterium]
MSHFDLKGAALRGYQPELSVPGDLEDFWESTLRENPAEAPTFQPVKNGLKLVDTHDVTFSGYGGAPIKGWLHVPAGATEPLPVVVQFIGYGGGRGQSHEQTLWATAGYAQFVMDTRGQGSASRAGHTPDPDVVGEPAHPGFMTRGILSPDSYYYRRVFTDAVRAVDAALTHPLVDAGHVAVAGGSQGGGIAIAAAALHRAVSFALIDVPFLCDLPRATSITDRDPYAEIVRYLKTHRERVEAVFATLAYFDGAVLGRRAWAEALFSVALMDDICPPSTVYGAYNWYGGSKSMVEYAYNNHEGGQAHHERVQLDWLAQRFGRTDTH